MTENAGDSSGGARGRPDFPPLFWPSYEATRDRAPQEDRTAPPPDLKNLLGPSAQDVFQAPDDSDLTTNAGTGSPPLGEKIIVQGVVATEAGVPVAGALVEIWQANAAGRYLHKKDQHDAPHDPNFTGVGHCTTTEDGLFRFVTITPGAYPVPGTGLWRPRHIHFSVIGWRWTSRLITQLYFPGDPLHDFDPIFAAVPEHARDRLIATYDPDLTIADEALGYRYDIILADATDGTGEWISR